METPLPPLESVFGPIAPMLDEVFGALGRDGINLDGFPIDHVCYRVPTTDRYERMKTTLSDYGRKIGEVPINGRPIAVFLLDEPLRYGSRSIECVELPAPKEGVVTPEGWEHFECVLGSDPELFARRHAGVEFDFKGMSKPINKELAKKYGRYGVKFHEHSLRYVVEVLEA